MANWYVSSVKYAAIAQWAASTAYTVGQLVRNLAAPTAANARVFKCTTAGTSGGTEPSWNNANNATTVSGTATFTQVGGQQAEQTSGNWAAALGTLAAAHNLSAVVVGDIVYVSDDHSESYGAGYSVQGVVGIPRICVAAGSTIPPLESELSRGATMSTTGNFILDIANNCLYKGFNFESGIGSTTNAGVINITASGMFDDCRFKISTTNNSAIFGFGTGTLSRGTVELMNDCRIEFGHVSQIMTANFSDVLIRDCPNLFNTATITPTSSVFSFGSTNGSRSFWTVRNCDLSNIQNLGAGGSNGWASFENCKLHASFVTNSGISALNFKNNIRLHNCTPSTSINNAFLEKGTYADIEIDTTLFRTGGASDGASPCSWKITAKTSCQYEGNKITPPRIAKRINTVGASMTFTVEAILLTSSAVAATRAKIWGEFNILTSGTSPIEELKSTRTSFLDATALQTSTEAWDTGLPARANSTSRPLGYLQKVASNPGRVFRVSVAGTTAASEPAAYATAVDGDTFADGTTTIVCGKRVKFEVTATPARAGIAFFSFQMQLASAEVVHIDPKLKAV